MIEGAASQLKGLRQHLFATGQSLRQPHVAFWFGMSLLFAAVFSLMGLQEAFQAPFTIQDDARQHIFWMQRFLDRDLFPNDLIADYYQSIAPKGFAAVYHLAASIGISPILASKLIPPLLALLNAGLSFWLCLELFPVPAAAFSASLLLGQALSMTDAVFSGTAKAFVYACALAFLLALVRRSLFPCLFALAIQSLFYPQMVLIAAGMFLLGVVEWREGRLRLCRSRQRWILCLSGVGVAVVAMLPFLLHPHEFGPTVTLEQARSMPEFLAGGRTRFFYNGDPERFWLHGRGGIRLAAILTPATNAIALALFFLVRFPKQFPLIRHLSPQMGWLARLILSSLAWFFAAHATLFTLYLPSRFTEHSLRIAVILGAGIALAVAIEAGLRWCDRVDKPGAILRSLLSVTLASALAALLLLYPAFTHGFPFTTYITGRHPGLYAFFQAQPKDSLIASLDGEANLLPTFAQRSILVGREYAIPYHTGYYRQIRQRASDLIEAQFSPSADIVKGFIEQYDINLWLLNRRSLAVETLGDRWLQQFQPAADEAIASLQNGDRPVLELVSANCTVFESNAHIVLDARCIEVELNYLTSRHLSSMALHGPHPRPLSQFWAIH
ncbi:hypothetical protein [Synechococcus sp. PCC 7336]|uniref:hypothetical protein n=1 Tax=Synechococcus sp. PCC 7336 TaxID=195250 RepID=UPI00034C9D0D|nr:hypothetical protein [Synechococcus sp. PCC 7336]